MKKILSVILAAGLLGAVEFAQAERSGEEVYKGVCMGCHLAGVAGAPKIGDSAAWQARYGGDLDQLLAGAKKGKNAMPPKGACGNCTDGELRAAIEHMSR